MYLRVEETDNYTRLSLFDETGKIDNEMILIIQKAGGGKSLACESITEEYWNNGYIIVSLTDVKDEMELCYAMFEPQESFHLKKLKHEGKLPSKKEVIIYHPFTFDLPRTLLPQMNMFTIPLKSLTRDKLQFIAETEKETDPIRLLLNGIDSLTNKQNIYDLIHYIQEKIGSQKKRYFGKNIVEADKDTFFLGSGEKGKSTDIAEIASWFKPFLKDYFLTPADFKLNLDVKKIFDKPKAYHCLVTKYISDPKMKYFAIFCFFDEIMRNIELCKHPICFVIEEVASIAPYKAEEYKTYMASYFRNKLLTIRSIGRGCSAIMTSQVWFDIDEKIREKATQIFFGILRGVADIDRIAKALKYHGEEVTLLKELERNTYILVGNEDMGGFRFFFPSHCHAESKYHFNEMYSKFYETVKYTDLVNQVNEHLKEINKFYKHKTDEERKLEMIEAEKEAERITKKSKVEEELAEMKTKIREKSELSREEKLKQVVELKNKNPDLTIRKIAETLGISKSMVSLYLKKGVLK